MIVFPLGLFDNGNMIIDVNSPVVSESSDTFWQDELTNARILLVQIETAINKFNSDGNIQSYTIDTGQDKQTVTRADINTLYTRRDKLLGEIQTLEARLRIGGPRCPQIMPGF